MTGVLTLPTRKTSTCVTATLAAPDLTTFARRKPRGAIVQRQPNSRRT